MVSAGDAETVMGRIEALAQHSEEAGLLVRRSFTDAMRRAYDEVAGWMRGAGLLVRQDNIGNLIGRYEGMGGDAKTLILGSHLDTVRDAGKFDGPLGVLVALACVERLYGKGERLPFAIEIICFTDEEGLRFGTSYLGSKVVAGSWDEGLLDLADADGVTLLEAIRAWGGDPEALQHERYAAEAVLGYCEVHIEQGPVLEEENLPVGVVTAINGQSRFTLTFSGQAGHAGTVPMKLRRDALTAAAEFVLAVETLAMDEPGLVATVGQLRVEPGASNVIPGRVSLSLDIRHADDTRRVEACRRLATQAEAICLRRSAAMAWELLQESSAAPCDPRLSRVLEQAVERVGSRVQRLPSGAGHDAVAMADLTPVAMLFVRCLHGVSHNPAESVEVADIAVAIEVISGFLELLAEQEAR